MTGNIRPIRVEGNIAFVPLSQGYEAVIDKEDIAIVAGHNWHATRKDRCVYAVRNGPRPDRKRIYIHASIIGALPGMEVDHINGDALDNRRQNLRFVTSSQNKVNRRTPSSNTSGVKGVSWHKASMKWIACISENGIYRYLGVHLTKEDAMAAYKAASAILHGEFRRKE